MPPPTLTGDAAAHVAERWAADGLHALAQLPAKCASAAAHAAHVKCDLLALLAATGPAGWRCPRLCRECHLLTANTPPHPRRPLEKTQAKTNSAPQRLLMRWCPR